MMTTDKESLRVWLEEKQEKFVAEQIEAIGCSKSGYVRNLIDAEMTRHKNKRTELKDFAAHLRKVAPDERITKELTEFFKARKS